MIRKKYVSNNVTQVGCYSTSVSLIQKLTLFFSPACQQILVSDWLIAHAAVVRIFPFTPRVRPFRNFQLFKLFVTALKVWQTTYNIHVSTQRGLSSRFTSMGHFHDIRSSIYIKEQKTVTTCQLESVKHTKIIRFLTLLALEQA